MKKSVVEFAPQASVQDVIERWEAKGWELVSATGPYDYHKDVVTLHFAKA